MRSAQISFKNKNVVIIGGGNQAFKKATDFLKEEANVSVVAKQFISDIPQSLRIYKQYEKEDIKNAFLVYACTDHKELNNQIVKDANALNILSANVHRDELATYHPLHSTDLTHLHLAYSTKGASPAYLKIMEEEFKSLYMLHFHEVLQDLKDIREYVLSLNIEHTKRSQFLRKLASLSPFHIRFYKNAIKQKQAVVFVFHGNEEHDTILKIESMLTEMDIACMYAFLNKESVIALESIKEDLQLLEINVRYQPMFLEEGFCFRKVKSILEEMEDIFTDDAFTQKLIKWAERYPQTLFVLHDSKEKKLKNLILNKKQEFIKVMELEEEIPSFDKNKEIYLMGIFVLSGTHLKKDVLSENGIYGKLLMQGYNVIKEERSLIEMDFYKEIIKKTYNN